jgi:hypothetical protein
MVGDEIDRGKTGSSSLCLSSSNSQRCFCVFFAGVGAVGESA